jgi:hypothetical protein
MHASYSVYRSNVCSELLVGVVVASLPHQIEIKLREQIGKRVSVVMFESFAIFCLVSQAVTGGCGSSLTDDWQGDLEEAFVAYLARRKRLRMSLQHKLRLGGTGLKESHHPTAPFGRIDWVRAEDAERIGVARR